MNKLNWLELALDKKDIVYPYKTSIYRGKNCFVATDGHRLHMQKNLADSTPMLLSGASIDYPSYELCVKQHNKNCKLLLTVEHYSALKLLLNYLDALGKTYVQLTFDGLNATFSYDYNREHTTVDSISVSHKLISVLDVASSYNAFLNPAYLLDALKMSEIKELKHFKKQSFVYDLNFNSGLDSLNITHDDLHAVVMPINPKKV